MGLGRVLAKFLGSLLFTIALFGVITIMFSLTPVGWSLIPNFLPLLLIVLMSIVLTCIQLSTSS